MNKQRRFRNILFLPQRLSHPSVVPVLSLVPAHHLPKPVVVAHHHTLAHPRLVVEVPVLVEAVTQLDVDRSPEVHPLVVGEEDTEVERTLTFLEVAMVITDMEVVAVEEDVVVDLTHIAEGVDMAAPVEVVVEDIDLDHLSVVVEVQITVVVDVRPVIQGVEVSVEVGVEAGPSAEVEVRLERRKGDYLREVSPEVCRGVGVDHQSPDLGRDQGLRESGPGRGLDQEVFRVLRWLVEVLVPFLLENELNLV